jgi:catechol 2,3-dioxygenase
MRVTILPDGVEVDAADDETLLRALARAGLRYRVGCKRGGCGVCKVQLKLGEVRYERPIAPQVLSDDERVEGICLSCRAVPLTNIVIELQEGDRLRRVLGFAFPTNHHHGRHMSAVMRLGYVQLRVTDLEEARNHYSNTLGMEVVHEEPGKLWLKCWDEWDHHSLVIEEGGVGLVKLGYKVDSPEALADFERRSQQFGATVGRFSEGENLKVGDGVRITLPSDHTLELYTDMEYAGTETGAINPEAWPRNIRGVGTHWIDHALISVDEPALVERFMSECLDFRSAERAVVSMEDPELLGSWMTCGESPHDLAFIKGPNNKLHHFAYHLEDWSSILKAGDIFSMDDVPIDIGPTRHGITRGTTIYFFDPAGNRNEVFAGLGYRAMKDFPTITWTSDQLAKGIFYHARELNEGFTTVFT